MQTRTITKKYTRVLADGTVREYTREQKYHVKDTHIAITDEIAQKIREYKALGVPATRIAELVGISAYRVRQC